jgi:hypothetical protein
VTLKGGYLGTLARSNNYPKLSSQRNWVCPLSWPQAVKSPLPDAFCTVSFLAAPGQGSRVLGQHVKSSVVEASGSSCPFFFFNQTAVLREGFLPQRARLGLRDQDFVSRRLGGARVV